MAKLPEPLHAAAAAFDSLPGIGPRAALRYAYWIASQPKEVIQQFARAFERLAHGIVHCDLCHRWCDASPCDICRDQQRDQRTVCVVATSQDVQALEDTGAYKGVYHVLGGTIDPLEGRTPDTLNILHLSSRIQASQGHIQEIILALDADISGDTTALYIKQQLKDLPVKITRLARGLPTGAQLEYADATTLANAMENRR